MSVSTKLDKKDEEKLCNSFENSCKVSKDSLDKKGKILPEISHTNIEKFNDTLSDNGYIDIEEYKERFLKYFNTQLKEYYEDFEEYFSEGDIDNYSHSSSDIISQRKSDREECISNTQENEKKLIKGQNCSIEGGKYELKVYNIVIHCKFINKNLYFHTVIKMTLLVQKVQRVIFIVIGY